MLNVVQNTGTVHVEETRSPKKAWVLMSEGQILTVASDRYNLIDECNRMRGHVCAECTFGYVCCFFPKKAA